MFLIILTAHSHDVGGISSTIPRPLLVQLAATVCCRNLVPVRLPLLVHAINQRKFSVQNFRVTDIQQLFNTPLIIHHLSYTTHHTPLIRHHSSYITDHTPLIIHH